MSPSPDKDTISMIAGREERIRKPSNALKRAEITGQSIISTKRAASYTKGDSVEPSSDSIQEKASSGNEKAPTKPASSGKPPSTKPAGGKPPSARRSSSKPPSKSGSNREELKGKPIDVQNGDAIEEADETMDDVESPVDVSKDSDAKNAPSKGTAPEKVGTQNGKAAEGTKKANPNAKKNPLFLPVSSDSSSSSSGSSGSSNKSNSSSSGSEIVEIAALSASVKDKAKTTEVKQEKVAKAKEENKPLGGLVKQNRPPPKKDVAKPKDKQSTGVEVLPSSSEEEESSSDDEPVPSRPLDSGIVEGTRVRKQKLPFAAAQSKANASPAKRSQSSVKRKKKDEESSDSDSDIKLIKSHVKKQKMTPTSQGKKKTATQTPIDKKAYKKSGKAERVFVAQLKLNGLTPQLAHDLDCQFDPKDKKASQELASKLTEEFRQVGARKLGLEYNFSANEQKLKVESESISNGDKKAHREIDVIRARQAYEMALLQHGLILQKLLHQSELINARVFELSPVEDAMEDVTDATDRTDLQGSSGAVPPGTTNA